MQKKLKRILKYLDSLTSALADKNNMKEGIQNGNKETIEHRLIFFNLIYTSYIRPAVTLEAEIRSMILQHQQSLIIEYSKAYVVLNKNE